MHHFLLKKIFRGSRQVGCALVCLASLLGLARAANPPSFPGAVGFGATATGGRADTVYYVTNLNDNGAGSFRDAVSQGNRTIEFQVGGYVQALSPIAFSSNLTIAGQTAPGQGFGVFGAEMSFSGTSNCIVRDMRFRDGSLDPNWPGTNGTNSHTNGMNLFNTNTMIFDHCSVEFGAYNNVDSTSALNVTVQNCIIADPIKEQQFNFHLDTGPGTFLGNIFANSHNRSILGKANLQFINNVDYNYQAGFTTGNSSGGFNYDFIGNDSISGPGTTNKNDAYYQVDNHQSAYATGNLINGRAANGIGGANVLTSYYFSTTTTPNNPTQNLPTVTAQVALTNNLANSGALPRDQVDALVVSQVASGGSSGPGGGLYSTQGGTGLANNGYGTINGGVAPVDSDLDGMPDYWETALGFAINSKSGPNLASDGSGYTNLEEYLNWLAGPHAISQQNASVQIDLSQYTTGLTNPTYAVTIIPTATTILPAGIGAKATTNSGTVTVSGSIATYTPTTSSKGLGGFTFTATASNGTISNQVYVATTTTAQPTAVIWKGNGTTNTWDNTNASNTVWNTTTGGKIAWTQGDTATLDDTGIETPAITLANAISTPSLTISTANTYTLQGTGSIGGETLSINGFGTGTVTFGNSGSNSFTGAASITDATVNINSSNSLGTGVLTIDNTVINVTSAGVSLINSSVAVVNTPSSVNFPHNGGSDFLPTITGTSPVDFSLNGTTVTLTNSVAGFTSTFTVNGPGNFRMDNNSNWGVPNGILNISGTAGIDNRSGGACTIPFGSLSGTAGTYLYGSDQASSAGTTCIYTIGSLNQSTTFAGAITNSGNQTVAITKTGTGTLTLSGANAYTGATTISGGEIFLTGTLGNSAVSVASGCSLIGTGTIGSTTGGAVTMQAAAATTTLSPGSATGQYGTLTVGNGLTLNGTTIPLNLSSNPAGTNDSIKIQGGKLTLSGTSPLQLTLANGALGTGVYTLISNTSGQTTTGSVANLSNNLPAATRQTLALSVPAGQVLLTVTGSPSSLVWTGVNNSAAWDLKTTTNFTNTSNAGASDIFYNLDNVTFDDTSTNNAVAVTGTVEPGLITVNNNATTYTLGGTGVIAGPGSLVKNGAGTLSVGNAGTNTFSGGVTINAGAANMNTNSAFGTGGVTLNGGTLNVNPASGTNINFGNNINVTASSTWNINGSGTSYWGGSLSGSAPLTLNSANVFTPGSTWAGYNSTITIAGTIRFNQGATIGSSGATFSLASSANIYNESTTDSTINMGALTGAAGSFLSGSSKTGTNVDTYVIGALNTSTTFGGIIQDGGHTVALTKVGTGTLTLTGAETYGGSTIVEGGTLVIGGSIASGSGTTVEVNSGANLALSNNTSTITADTIQVDSGGTLSGNGTLAGSLTNNGTVTASQGGTFSITGDVANSGTLTVTNSTVLSASGVFVNTGTLDLRQAGVTSLPGLVNSGNVLTGVSLSNLSATFDGNPHAATVTTNPPGVSVAVTYQIGSNAPTTTPPTAAGSYTVAATVNQSNYQGTATGTLVIAAPTQTFANWLAFYNLPTDTTSQAVALSENDGVVNLLKYLFDINPDATMAATDYAALPDVDEVVVNSVPYLTMTYRQYISETGLTILVQASPDLQTWTPLTLTTGTPTATTYTLQQIGTDSNTGDPIMQVQTALTGSNQFLRLNVTLNP